MNTRLFFLLVLPALLLSACIRPVRELTSFRDPAFKHTRFRRIAVIAETGDLQLRHDLESYLMGMLRQMGIDAVAGNMILVPTREWSESDRLLTLAGKGFDGYLHLSVNGVETWQTTVPAISTTQVKREMTSQTSGDSERPVETETVTTRIEDGFTIQNTRTRYEIRMIDMKSRGTAWLGLNNLEGSSGTSLSRFSEEIAMQLIRDTVLLASWSPTYR